MKVNLKNICERAMAEGRQIDLGGCVYGVSHWGGAFVGDPAPYYYFLAGFVRSQRSTSIFEIGTHFGGSVMSMSRGLREQDMPKSRLVTVDLTRENEENFARYPHIKRIQGDALDKAVARQVMGCFDREIDIMFIDSDHEREHVKRCIALYGNKLRPKYIILDDIKVNESMKCLWQEITAEFNDKAFDVTDISGRERTAGFGVIYWDHAFKWNWKYKELLLAVYSAMKKFQEV